MAMSAALLAKIQGKKKAIQQSSGKREDVLRLQMGKNKLRILPAHPDLGPDAEFWADLGQHYIKSEEKNERGNNKVKAVYICVDKTFGRECPICQGIETLMPQCTDDEQLALLEESKCKRAEVLLNVMMYTGDKQGTPQILQMTPSTFELVLGLMDEYGDITDLDNGVTLVIERTGSGLNTKYSVIPAAKSEPVPHSVLSQMKNLKEFVQQEYDDGLKRALTALNSTVGLMLDAPIKPALSAPKTVSAPKVEDDDGMSDIMEADFEELTGTHDAVAPKASAPAAAAPAEVDEMDALLADLEGL